MAFCLKCGASMEPTAAKCEECGYEFPEIGSRDDERRRLSTGWAYSSAADILLLSVQILLGLFVALTIVVLLIWTPMMIFDSRAREFDLWFRAVLALLSALVSLIVLIRVGNL